MHMRAAVVCAAALLVGLPHAASAVLIDDFTADQSVLIPTGPPNPQTQDDGVADPGAIGGARAISLSRSTGFGLASLDSNLTEAGTLSFNTAAAVVASGLVTYDGNTDNVLDPTGLGGVDVTDGGTSSILRLVVRSDLAATVRVSFLEDASNASVGEFAVPGTGTGNPFQVLDIPLASLTPVGAGADLTNVGAIQVAIEGPASLDLQIDRVETVVPEPGTLLLLGIGTLGIGVLGRRRA